MQAAILKENLTQVALIQNGVSQLLGLMYLSSVAKSICIFLNKHDQWRLSIHKTTQTTIIDCTFGTSVSTKKFVQVTRAAVNNGCAVSLPGL